MNTKNDNLPVVAPEPDAKFCSKCGFGQVVPAGFAHAKDCPEYAAPLTGQGYISGGREE